MQERFAEQLRNVLSIERLQAYSDKLSQDGNKYLFCHYTWNIALSESLYPTLQAIEVTLRNVLHNKIQEHAGQDDWFHKAGILRRREQDAVRKAEETLRQKRKPLEPGRILAELSFGFWTSLFDSRYEQVLWPVLIKNVFPNMPRKIRTRKTLSRRFNRIRNLRNRIFHHEPVWYWQDLSGHHKEILEAISWIEPSMEQLVTAIDRFPLVYRRGLDEIEQKLKVFC